MITLDKNDNPIIELYKKEDFDHDYKLNKDAKPSKTLYLDKSNNDKLIIEELQNNIPMPYINKKKRNSFFISGASGSYKSTTASNLINLFLQHIPNINVIYFTGITLDEPLEDYFKYLLQDEYKYRCVIFTPQSFIDFKKNNEKNKKLKLRIPLSVQDIHNIQDAKSTPFLIVFDDIDNINNPIIRKLLLDFQAQILNEGRSHNKKHKHIHIISISHCLSAQQRHTQLLIRESDYASFNLKSHNRTHIIALLRLKYGFDEEDINEILKQKKEGGGITFFSSHWPYLIFNDKAIFIS